MQERCVRSFGLWLALSLVASAGSPAPAVRLSDVSLKGTIAGENITFVLEFGLTTETRRQEVALVTGDVVVESAAVTGAASACDLRYDLVSRTYSMYWPKRGQYHVSARIAARPKVLDDAAWREASFEVPAGQFRQLELSVDRTDLEVLFPGALRVNRETRDGGLVLTATLGPGQPFAVRWKPQVAELESELVFGCEANTIATVSPGAVALDSLFAYEVVQGKLRELDLAVPKGLSVTQVRGAFIRDWRLSEAAGESRQLQVVLSRPEARQYSLQVTAESVLPPFPADVELPVIEPKGGIRNGGALAVGTNSAVQLRIKQTGGLSQVDATAFPRLTSTPEQPRPLPQAKLFAYTFASTPYQMALGLDDIVPAFDAEVRLGLELREDDLVADTEVELDIRDAPIRQVTVAVPARFVVASVAGQEVDDHTVREGAPPGAAQEVEVHFRQPVLGRTLIKLRLELGKSPLDTLQAVAGFAVPGAKSVRGYVTLALDRGVQADAPTVEGLRQVHTSSVPGTDERVQSAYRFREPGWSLSIKATRRPAGVRVEALHLVSLGEGVLYGGVALSYFISGAPMDEFRFRLPKDLSNVEFVGQDVRRWLQDNGEWVVKLQRRVLGDYNLGVSFTQRYQDGDPIAVGTIECAGVQTQTGYIALASHLNLNLEPAEPPGPNVLEIEREEVPANYRLLVNAPVLRTYKYVAAPHRVALTVKAYQRGSVLPIVVEVMDLDTSVSVRENRLTESVTRVRWKVKNSSAQFLSLRLPAGARVWATRQIERLADGTEKSTHVAASRDGDLLKIGLTRQRNPNDPVTLELEYGQEHGKAAAELALGLVAPSSPVRATFAQWRVSVPAGWAVFPGADGNMAAEGHDGRLATMAAMLHVVLGHWRAAWGSLVRLPLPRLVCVGLVILGLAGLLLILRRALLVRFGVALVLGLICLAGVMAAGHLRRGRDPDGAGRVSVAWFRRALSPEDSAPLMVSLRMVPAWRATLDRPEAVTGGAVVAVGLALALWLRRLRPALLALALAAGALVAAQFSVCGPVLLHLFTWGMPVLALVLFAGDNLRLWWRSRPGRGAVAGLLLLTGSGLSGHSAEVQAGFAPATILDAVDCRLTVERDSVKADLRLKLQAERPTAVRLLDTAAILLSPDAPAEGVTVRRLDGAHTLSVERRGDYSVELSFLCALAAADENQVRQFTLPLPLALWKQVELRIPQAGLDVEAPTAVTVRHENDSADGTTQVQALLGPADDACFAWKPRVRQTKLEKTAFFVEHLALFRLDSGLAEGHHRIHFQVAQGELRDIHLTVPQGMAVTTVDGPDLGAWRFDPAKRELEVRLARPATEEYDLKVLTQSAHDSLPYTVTVGPLGVRDAVHQRGALGLAPTPTVYLTVEKHPEAMNVDDFLTAAGPKLAELAGISAETVRHAYRIQSADDAITTQVNEVKPEIRTRETAGFTVADDRLVYNGEFTIEITKAGVFAAELRLPETVDLDALTAPEVSHWDDTGATPDGTRGVRVYFRQKLQGKTTLKIALSRAVAELPREVVVPRVSVVGSVKHEGQVLVSSDRGVRLVVGTRHGVSELDPSELGLHREGTLAFRLLRPDWTLALQTEVVKPRISVEFLHLAKVSEGLVRHTHHFIYRLQNAGAKVFELTVPPGAMGVVISGPEIARRETVPERPGAWRVELARKWFDQPYPLLVSYETQYDREKGEFPLLTACALDADLQHGHVVLYATDRVELATTRVGPALLPADARNVAGRFGAGDLSAAAFCFSSATPQIDLMLRATRHESAGLLEAEVLSVELVTVAAETGETVNQARVQLKVSSKRHLQVRLPPGAAVWSLMVNRKAQAPSLRAEPSGRDLVLVPLAPGTSGELPVCVELIYAAQPAPGWSPRSQRFAGIELDLPLRQVTWRLYVPEDRLYSVFGGTLTVDREFSGKAVLERYDSEAYEADVARANADDLRRAAAFQCQGNQLAQNGRQYEAKQALASAYNYSFADPALNEDTRVQLHRLVRQQALVGLVSRRSRLRQETDGGADPGAPGGSTLRDLGDDFNQAEAERLQGSLNKADSENLERITERLIEIQEAAAGSVTQLLISMPLRGRVLRFGLPLQVQPNAPMAVTFAARPPPVPQRYRENAVWFAGLAAMLTVLFWLSRMPVTAAPVAGLSAVVLQAKADSR